MERVGIRLIDQVQGYEQGELVTLEAGTLAELEDFKSEKRVYIGNRKVIVSSAASIVKAVTYGNIRNVNKDTRLGKFVDAIKQLRNAKNKVVQEVPESEIKERGLAVIEDYLEEMMGKYDAWYCIDSED